MQISPLNYAAWNARTGVVPRKRHGGARLSQGLIFVCLWGLTCSGHLLAETNTPAQRIGHALYEIWEREPAANRGPGGRGTQGGGRPFDPDWERHSMPIGNGYMGANIFGRTDTDRIQITDKGLHNRGVYAEGGLTSFAELYLDFGHDAFTDYRRALNLNDAIVSVAYTADGVRYRREYFASYPDKVLVIRLTADRPKSLSFRIRPEVPYLERRRGDDQRTAETTVAGDLITVSGTAKHFHVNYEAQIKVLNEGGTLSQGEDTITVRDADSVTIILATGTNYELSPRIFLQPPGEKLDHALFPHENVSHKIQNAAAKGFTKLRENHLQDYRNLFGRVAINFGSTPSKLPTSELLQNYRNNNRDTWLDELFFQFGRYLLIASSRETSLPANLQGTWSQFNNSPWTGGYWHNINVQMNYWGAKSANLAETFQAYIEFFKAYLPKAQEYATEYVKQNNPDNLHADGDNGWILGTHGNAYYISPPERHSGPGTGGMTAKMLMDYYLFTGDEKYLEEVAYPAMLSLSRFYSAALIPHGDLLLVEPSASPEQRVSDEQLARGLPGRSVVRNYYVTAGTTFDQGFVWEAFNDTLILAERLGKEDPFLQTIAEQNNWQYILL